MDMHKNARLTPRGRERIVRQVLSGQTPEAVALAAGVCPRTVRKWVARYRGRGRGWAEGPHVAAASPAPADAAAMVEQVAALRRQRWTGKEIAAESRRLASHREPHPAAAGLQTHQRTGTGRAGSPLRAREPRRTDPPRYQEARPLRAGRPSHHRTADWRRQPPSASAGSSSTSASTTLPASPSPRC